VVVSKHSDKDESGWKRYDERVEAGDVLRRGAAKGIEVCCEIVE
jgi:hypothetical protein